MGSGASASAYDKLLILNSTTYAPRKVIAFTSEASAKATRFAQLGDYNNLSSIFRSIDNVNRYSSTILSLLEEASKQGHLDCMELIFQHLALPLPLPSSSSSSYERRTNATNVSLIGGFALHIAAESLQQDAVDLLLLTSACSANSTDPFSRTALHRLCTKAKDLCTEDVEIIASTLIHYMTSNAINCKDAKGNTALHICARNGNVALCNVLITSGASVKIRNLKMKTASDLASIEHYSELSKAIERRSVSKLLVKQSRAPSAPIDLARAMAVWDRFFENAMKANLGHNGNNYSNSSDDGGIGVKSRSNQMLYTPRVGAVKVSDVRDSNARLKKVKKEKENEKKEEVRKGESDEIFWTQCHDTDFGTVYYFNEMTGESCWNQPEEGTISTYVVMWDNLYQQDFYYVFESGESVWEKPVQNSWKEEEEDEGELAEECGDWLGWTECFDESSGRNYYYHSLTSETSWNEPEDGSSVIVKRDSRNRLIYSFRGGSSVRSTYPWRQLLEEEQQCPYFLNERTRETKWEIDFEDVETNME